MHITNSQTQKINAMTKEEILDLMRSQEKMLYDELKDCKRLYGVDHRHTRYALGAWGSILNLLNIIQNENN